MEETNHRIRSFIIENFLFGNDDGLTDDASFLDEGIIDSTGVLELVTYLEEQFHIKVMDDELVPENFDSINKVANFIERKTESPTRNATAG